MYIIGNGFDQHHEIKSSYKDFYSWMCANNQGIMNKVYEIYNINDEQTWWSDFENQLASLKAIRYGESIAFKYPPDLDSEHCDRTWNDAAIEVEHQLEGLYFDVRGCFHDWILQLNKPSESKKIKILIENSVFLNFNYTKTLETLYGINPHHILHIHGCVDDDEEFILGHGKTYEELNRINAVGLPELPEELPAGEVMRFYEERSKSAQELHEQFATDAAISGVASQRKPVDEIMKKHESFFNSTSDVSYVHVYGHSLSEIDMPYIDKILSNSKSAIWEFSYHNDADIKRIENFCETKNIENYSLIDLDSIIDSSQLEIQFPQ